MYKVRRKEVGIAIKSKETSSQLQLVRNGYVAIMHQPVTISSKQPCSQMHVQIKHSLAHLQDALAGVITYIFYTSQCRD